MKPPSRERMQVIQSRAAEALDRANTNAQWLVQGHFSLNGRKLRALTICQWRCPGVVRLELRSAGHNLTCHMGLPSKSYQKLYLAHSSIGWAAFSISRYICSCNTAIPKLGWISVGFLVQFKGLIILYEVQHGIAPGSLQATCLQLFLLASPELMRMMLPVQSSPTLDDSMG